MCESMIKKYYDYDDFCTFRYNLTEMIGGINQTMAYEKH